MIEYAFPPLFHLKNTVFDIDEVRDRRRSLECGDEIRQKHTAPFLLALSQEIRNPAKAET